jgi:hypothetical protein
MTFREWLPQTRRNRLALGFAALALILFVSWNLHPYRSYSGAPIEGTVAQNLWPEILDPSSYYYALRNPNLEDAMGCVASLAIILSALLSLSLIPLWRFFHSSRLLNLPPAILCLIGSGSLTWFLARFSHQTVPREWFVSVSLMALNLFCISLSLFAMKPEHPPATPPQP